MIQFSIITITYNAAHELQRTLDSVAMQQYPIVEHLIIDGKSTDDTVRIANAYAQVTANQKTRHSVTVLSEPDRGLYDAMNKGIRLATGDYIVFLNAGDTLPAPDTLCRVAEVAAAKSVMPGVIYGETDIVDDQGRFVRHRRLSPPRQLHWQSFRQGMVVCHQAFYARIDFAKANLYNLSYRYSADVDWCIRVMRDAERVGCELAYVPAVVVNYLDGGLSVKNHRKALRERFLVMRSHYGLVTTLAMHAWFVIRGIMKR